MQRTVVGAGAAVVTLFLGASAVTPSSGGRLASTSDSPLAGSKRFVAALGRLETGRGVIKVGGTAGKRVQRLQVAPNQRVNAHEIIAYLEDHELALNQAAQAAAALREAKLRLASELQSAGRAVEEAKLAVQRVELLDPIDVSVAAAKLRRVEAEFNAARRELERSAALQASRSVSQSEIDDLKLRVRAAEENVEESRCMHAYSQSKLDWARLDAEAKLSSAQSRENLTQASSTIESLANALKVAEQRVELSIVRAPASGEILSVSAWPGEIIGSAPIVTMGDTARMYAVAEVYETDVRHIAVGGTAIVRSEALSSELTGVVEEISRMVRKNDVLDIDPLSDADSRVVEVRVRLDDSSKAGYFIHLQVEVDFSLEAAKPLQANDAIVQTLP